MWRAPTFRTSEETHSRKYGSGEVYVYLSAINLISLTVLLGNSDTVFLGMFVLCHRDILDILDM
jgi:membrane protein YqaA with SNARE-associated domain